MIAHGIDAARRMLRAADEMVGCVAEIERGIVTSDNPSGAIDDAAGYVRDALAALHAARAALGRTHTALCEADGIATRGQL